jgi:hypothetical protein
MPVCCFLTHLENGKLLLPAAVCAVYWQNPLDPLWTGHVCVCVCVCVCVHVCVMLRSPVTKIPQQKVETSFFHKPGDRIRTVRNMCWKEDSATEKFFFAGEAVLGFELSALYLLGRRSTTWATPSALWVLVIFEIGSCIVLVQSGSDSSIYVSSVHRIIDLCHHTQFLLVEMGSLQLFDQDSLEPRCSWSQLPK